MKILAIRLARFGDIVLLLRAFGFLKAQLPQSHLTFLTDNRWAPLGLMCPAIDGVVGIDRLGMRDGSLLNAIAGIRHVDKELRSRHFDAAIDFHGFRETSLMAWWSGAPRRMGLRRFDQSYWNWCFNMPPVVEDKSIHVSEMFLRVAQGFVPATLPAGPDESSLVIPAEAVEWRKANLPPAPYVALYVDAPVKDRVWPKERFEQVARHFDEKLGVSVVVLSTADRDWKSSNSIRALSGLSIPQLAAAIGSARMLISNDTGPMHLGPALRIPTLGIFSVGFPEHFRPMGLDDVVVRGNPIEQVETDEVIAAANRLWLASAR